MITRNTANNPIHFANPFLSFPDFFAIFLQVDLTNENRSKNLKN